MEQPTLPPLVDSVEAAKMLGLHRATVNTLAAEGILKPAIKLGGRTGARLFSVETIEAYKRTRRAS